MEEDFGMTAKKRNMIVWIVFALALFAGLCIFFFKIDPVTVFDTDDWSILTNFRKHRFLPGKDEWNPSRVMPEIMMPFAGFVGRVLFIRARGFYDAAVMGMGLVLAAFITAYVALTARMIGKKFGIGIAGEILIELFVLFVHFIAFITGKGKFGFFFYEMNACSVFYYTIPTIFNCIIICLTIIYEEYIRHFFRKEHIVCKIVYLIMIYFAVFSNLYASVVIAAFSAAKILQYFFIEVRDRTTDRIDKLIQCSVYIYTLILWFVSMAFELAGGRATQFSEVKFDVKAAFLDYKNTFYGKNILFDIMIAAALVFYIVMLVRILRNKDRFVKPIIERVKTTSKKKRDELMIDPMDELLFSYVNQTSLYLVCFVLTSAFLILLRAKTGAGYFGHLAVQLNYFMFLLMNVYGMIAYLIRMQKKVLYGVAVLVAAMAWIAMFSGVTYSEYNMRGLSNENCKALADYITEQYVEADENNVEYAYIHVPNFHTEDNFPIANYGNARFANTLYQYGVTSRFINSELVLDDSLNERFGL